MKKELRNLEKMLEIYMIAERREKEAHEFYKIAAEKTEDEGEKKVLLDLAEFEMQHLKLMQRNYEKTLKKIEKLQQNN